MLTQRTKRWTLIGMSLAITGGALAAGDFATWQSRPDEPFTDGEAAFQQVLTALKRQYVDDALTDDELYRAASRGLLQYADAKRTDWNRLYTPTEYAELEADLRGEVVGVGLDFRFEDSSGMGVVRAVLDGTPAQAAELKAGDRILKVDGRSFAGHQIRDMVYAIRGRAGTQVTLTILRDAEVFEKILTRAAIAFEETQVKMLESGIALVSIHGFSSKTVDKLRTGINSLPRDQVKGLVVDLRRCGGGSFEAAVGSAALFLDQGKTIVRLRKRGGVEEVKAATDAPLISSVPMSVMIDHDTASGCELVAASFKQSYGATLVGSKTFGKWSMQTVDKLPNGYAMKYTVASFFPPDGSDLEGVGLSPDVPVSGETEEGQDLQLQTAKSVLD
jgi:carboxyl-terminal processing protease